MVDGLDPPVLDHDLAVDDDGMYAATGLAVNDLPHRIVERKIGRIGQVEERKVRRHADFYLAGPYLARLCVAALAGKPDRMRAGGRGHGQRVCGEEGAGGCALPRTHVADKLHRLEDALRVARTG